LVFLFLVIFLGFYPLNFFNLANISLLKFNFVV
jgi:hypothetical protein